MSDIAETINNIEVAAGWATPAEVADLIAAYREQAAELTELRTENNIPTKYVQEGGVQYCIWGTSSISAYNALELKYTALREKLRKLEDQEPVAWQNTINGFIAKHQTAEYQIALVPKLYTKEPK